MNTPLCRLPSSLCWRRCSSFDWLWHHHSVLPAIDHVARPCLPVAGDCDRRLVVADLCTVPVPFGPVMGNLSDRFGRRPVLLGSLFGFAVDFLVMAFAPNLAWLFATRMLTGIFGATNGPSQSVIADVLALMTVRACSAISAPPSESGSWRGRPWADCLPNSIRACPSMLPAPWQPRISLWRVCTARDAGQRAPAPVRLEAGKSGRRAPHGPKTARAPAHFRRLSGVAARQP